MARFDVHRNLSDDTTVPFLVDIQSDLLSELRTRIVIPLIPLPRFGAPMAHLNPIFAVEGGLHALATTDLAGVGRAVLGQTVGSLDNEADEIMNAVEFLLHGF